jgi:hypothetical protein
MRNLKYKWLQLKNWWFFFKRMGEKKCHIKYMHDFPDMPCMRCSPKEWKASQKERCKTRDSLLVGAVFDEINPFEEDIKNYKNWKKKHSEELPVGDMFEDRQNFRNDI